MAGFAQVMSVIVIIGILFFIALKVSQLYLTFKDLDVRLSKVEVRLDALEKKVDWIIEYLLNERTRTTGK